MPYNIDPRVLYALVHGSPHDVQAMMPFVQQSSYVSPQQVQSEWEAQMPFELTDKYAEQKAQEAYDNQKNAYINNSVRQLAESMRARSSGGALGGGQNSFADARVARINADGSQDALALADATRRQTFNQEIQRINQRRAQMQPPTYADSFGEALGPWGSMIGSGGAGRQSGMSVGSSTGYGGGYSQMFSRQPMSSRIAQAGTGLYELLNTMRRNNIGARQIGYGIGSAAKSLVRAPGQFARRLLGG